MSASARAELWRVTLAFQPQRDALADLTERLAKARNKRADKAVEVERG